MHIHTHTHTHTHTQTETVVVEKIAVIYIAIEQAAYIPDITLVRTEFDQYKMKEEYY